MKKPIYIFNNGELKRKDNSLYFIKSEEEKKNIPVNAVSEIHIFGELDINKRTLEFFNITKNSYLFLQSLWILYWLFLSTRIL